MTKPPVGQGVIHESAIWHVSGQAAYVDDIPSTPDTLHLALTCAEVTCGTINHIDTKTAKSAIGVHAVWLAEDIQQHFGTLMIGPLLRDEPLLALDEVLFYGQPLAMVIADSFENAQRAAALVQADINEKEAIISVAQAIEKNSYLREPFQMHKGNAKESIINATHRLKGQMEIGGQEHFYLESQVSYALPSEGGISIYCSTQNPTEIQHLVADVLGCGHHMVEVVVRRMGGGFGGKETDASQVACLCALLAKHFKRPVKGRLPRKIDMLITGKRHDYLVKYEVGFDSDGQIDGIEIDFYARCGYSMDLSQAIVSRTLFHADNVYYLPNASFTGHLCKTNTVSNTAFRGFGGPQGMVAIENIIEEIAYTLKQDALVVRKQNFYGKTERNITPYGQTIEDNIIHELVDELTESAAYQRRKLEMDAFNQQSSIIKKGMALSPVKFGISFTVQFLNQAGALVLIYTDGSIHINHGGTEMGQGLFTKMAQIAATAFGLEMADVQISATDTSKVPNTSPTAASSGADLNGMAIQNACNRIKANLLVFAQQHFDSEGDTLIFTDKKVSFGNTTMPFIEFIKLAYFNRVELFSNGYYRTPKIYYDPKTAKGRPFYYYAYGAAITEVALDTLTGEYKVLAVDILHDAGASLNPDIDKGQVTGGFIQGMGWLCSEELKWDDKGKLLNQGAATYKIPAIGDTPPHFKVQLKPNISNHEKTIHKSKAVGEPPLMLAISAWLAVKNAIHNTNHKHIQGLNAPASFEQVFFNIHKSID